MAAILGVLAGIIAVVWFALWRWASAKRPPTRSTLCSYCKHDMMSHRISFGTTRCKCCQESRELAKKNR